MSATERTKGRNAEAEVRRIYEAHGWAVRGLEGGGDHVCMRNGVVIHSEVKRQETVRLPLWARQAWAEAAAGCVPTVAFRRSREPWRIAVPFYCWSGGSVFGRSDMPTPHVLRTLNERLWLVADLLSFLWEVS